MCVSMMYAHVCVAVYYVCLWYMHMRMWYMHMRVWYMHMYMGNCTHVCLRDIEEDVQCPVLLLSALFILNRIISY